MKKLSWWGRIVCGCAFGFGLVAQAQESGGRFIVQAGTDATFGEFTYEDATVDISEEFFNPRLSAEFVFPNSAIAVGVAYAASENTYSLDFDDGKRSWMATWMSSGPICCRSFVSGSARASTCVWAIACSTTKFPTPGWTKPATAG